MKKRAFKFAVLLFLCGLGALIFMSSVIEKPQSQLYSGDDVTVINPQEEGIAQASPPFEPAHESSITIGMKAPDFILPNADGQEFSLYSFLQEGPVILSFYRGGWCPVCNDQLYAYQQILPEFEELGAQLVAISPEGPQSAQDTMSKNYITYQVLTDAGNKVAREYDLIWSVPEESREAFSSWLQGETGKTLAEWNGIDNYELPIPATFVIAQDGRVVYVFKNEDYKQRAKNEDILQALKNLTEHSGNAQ